MTCKKGCPAEVLKIASLLSCREQKCNEIRNDVLVPKKAKSDSRLIKYLYSIHFLKDLLKMQQTKEIPRGRLE